MSINNLSRKDLILGLAVMVIGMTGLLASLFLVLRQATYQGLAGPEEIPRELRVTNLSENSASISWTTDKPGVASVVYGTNQEITPSLLAFDDRGGNTASTVHYITLKNLKPATAYYFRLICQGRSFDNQGTPYVFSTPQHTSFTPSVPFVIKGKQTPETMVYFSFASSTSLSTLTDENGNYLLSLNNALTKSLERSYPVQKGEKGYLLFQDGKKSLTQEVVVEDEMTLAEGTATETAEPSSLKSKLPIPVETWLPSILEKFIEFVRNLLGRGGI